MYIPAHFQLDMPTAYSIIRENSFATLFSLHDGLPYASHLPILLHSSEKYLYGHFAAANPQWRDLGEQTVLTVFHGPHGYISPSWYETNQAVPTWNYVAVHVYGTMEFIDVQDELVAGLRDMIATYEQPQSGYGLQDMDPEWINGLTRSIRGFKIQISKIEGKAKLSQNHSTERQQLIIQQLEANGGLNEQRISALMKMPFN
ncbi:FMN-binding negative transcriptional regulator [Paenibacillus athensensis]|uniref:Transcriptional regulator n=1 Tax=Paenibacillus athensensis TaxID=1967502 RepID=A0A4Y8Q649_9BACL|nr:FMN-binding negative transcriptional regulator [Paenibacillus athensensis]MCD1259821.1 FMN-binding negative transcriptional regulator [Paenibacillus athensensis]